MVSYRASIVAIFHHCQANPTYYIPASFHHQPSMVDRRPEVDQPRHTKRRKTEDGESVANPYLAHKYEEFVEASSYRKLAPVKSGGIDPTAKPFIPKCHEDPTVDSNNKNQDGKPDKSKSEHMDPKANPYLAHMYEDSAENSSYSNGYGKQNRIQGTGTASALAKFPRHRTNAAMAKEAENGPNNPFNGKPLSKQYFSILDSRRNLPVHAQR